ncbi:MAG: hypothetical protein M5R36_04795 [Deltaproteobacteria bacterium]|nr:hypothetical protein [Deltaproteobacteria bacterium]
MTSVRAADKLGTMNGRHAVLEVVFVVCAVLLTLKVVQLIPPALGFSAPIQESPP